MKYKAYPEYKDSGVEWLGGVPHHWEVIQIKHLSTVKRGASPRPIDDAKYFDDDGEYAWTRIADVTASDVYLTKAPQKLSDLGSSLSVKLEPESLFLSIAGTVGKPCITGVKACIHDGFVYFPGLKIPSKFLFYVFAGEQAYKGLGKFGTQLNLNTDTVGGIKIGCASNGELQEIVNFLDLETAKIDTLIEKQQQLIKLLKEKRQAVISHAVTKGLNPNAPMKDSGIEWLGEVPAHWTEKRLGYVAEGHKTAFVDGPFGSDLKTSDYQDVGVPLIQLNNIRDSQHLLQNMKYITPNKKQELKRHIAKPGDIVIAKMAEPVARCAVVKKHFLEYVIVADCVKMTPDLGMVNLDYLVWAINSDAVRISAEQVATGTTRIRVNLGELKKLKIPYPPLDEQAAIAEYLGYEASKIDTLIDQAKSMVGLIKERRTALISAAVTGKIDVRAWKTATGAVT